ncbi:MAG: hypothetical protein QF830_04135 [Rhodospirillales bacterium]|jgi:hypothetical protein|nr:hypothetical protein [Rhodospirillales bacterium]MDP6883305.1 hypothetical protein [Rhodospirillales bacterium]MDP7097212.1 hypothetical protein [Rhodospirillales bacterium]MDP7547056.1 hypothetical protein [Alphaproteobacteria bacterium]|tara:strand:+ start:4131 stop:4592 length:462 start_codon:yes stop_codon:yes gene_type:complete
MTKIYSWLDTPDGGFTPPQAPAGEPQLDADGYPAPPVQPYIYLCAIDGVHYCSIADGFKLPRQKKIVNLRGPLTFKKDADVFKRIRKQADPCKEIDAHVSRAIRERYSLNDELQALREDDQDYKAFVEGLVNAARSEKAALGLYPGASATTAS